MLFNGTILIPINFDAIDYKSDDAFECRKGNITVNYKVSIMGVELVLD